MKVEHDSENSRYIMKVSGSIAKVDYRLEGNQMFLTYAEVPVPLQGQGIGKKMVEQVFDMLTNDGYEGVAVCGFVRSVQLNSEKWKDGIKSESKNPL